MSGEPRAAKQVVVATGQRHPFVLRSRRGSFELLLQRISEAHEPTGSVMLRADDGSYARSLVIEEVGKLEPEGWCTLRFDDVPSLPTYTCTVTPAGATRGYTLFSGATLELGERQS